MVNVFTALTPLLHGAMKLAGVTPQLVEIEPGTIINFWVPNETICKTKTHIINNNNNNNNNNNKTSKPAIVFLHGFTGNGILTWLFQVVAFAGEYAVYVPDLLFFGNSFTDKAERSPTFQAQCFEKGLRMLGVEKCVVVAFSYGGMVGFKMAELYPDLVMSLVACGAPMELTESISKASFRRIGISSWPDFLLPETVEGVKFMLSTGSHKFPWFPHFLFRDFLKVMFDNRKQRVELLEALVVKDTEATSPHYTQRIHLLWGKDDKIFDLGIVHDMKQKLGDKATFECIEEAGHLLHLERPWAFNQSLKKFLASLVPESD